MVSNATGPDFGRRFDDVVLSPKIQGHAMQTDVAPTRPQERVDELDFIRGLALFGIFLMNLPSFAIAFDESWLEPGIPGKTWLDQAALLLQDVLLAGKFNSMFSLLFAIGFTLQLERLHTALPAGKADLVYVRRLLFLLALGMAHYLVFWNGDILHTYALLGFLLLWLRRWSDRELLLLALGCIVAPTLVDVWRYLHLSAADLQRMMEDSIERSRAAEAVWQHGSVMQTISLTLQEGVRHYHGARQLVGQFGAYTLILTTLCLGLIIGRNHWYRDLGVRLPALIRWQWIALAIGLTTGGVVGLSD
jgi:uncharacterized protein